MRFAPMVVEKNEMQEETTKRPGRPIQRSHKNRQARFIYCKFSMRNINATDETAFKINKAGL
jgi:hypothetical protein